MRRILIENARRRKALRHGGGQVRLDIQEVEVAAPAADDQLLAIDEALSRFSALDPKKAELVKLRYFIGLTIVEAAATLGISEATAKRWWEYARAWLFSEVRDSGGWSPPPARAKVLGSCRPVFRLSGSRCIP